MAAALSIAHSFHTRRISTQDLIKISNCRINNSIMVPCCQSRVPFDPSRSETKKVEEREKEREKLKNNGMSLLKFLVGVEKLGKGVKDSLSPKQKGDWKDLVLMSLSFAVYVYISQKLVCAYCVWMSMLKQPW